MTAEPKTDDDPLVYDTISKRRLEFLRATIAKGMTDQEIAHGLEIAHKYDLDALVGEFWMRAIDKASGGREVLLMVGRDGLRKIAMKQRMVIDGDVVHAADEFTVTRNPDRTRTVTHTYAAKDRGDIIGAWAEVYDHEGQQRGYFYAPLDEYLPTNEKKLKYSPWGSQRSVMTLAAAERTALGMATPLSGILSPGELDRADEQHQLGAGSGNGEPEGIPLPPEVEAILTRAAELGHAGLASRAAAETAVGDQPPEAVERWVHNATVTLDAMAAGQAVDGEAVEDV